MKLKVNLPVGVALFAALALAGLMGLFALTTAPSAEAQEDSTTIEYAENGKDPVATFTAVDPEGVTPIVWSLAADAAAIEGVGNADIVDLASFVIDDEDGTLKFMSPPDYEAETNGGGDEDNDNTYHVVVLAADAADNRGYHKVTVKVTNVAETGKVTWTVDHDGGATHTETMPKLMQFQVGASLEVNVTDGVTDSDVSGTNKNVTERLQWYRSSSKTDTGTAIDGEIDDEYTVTTEDVGMYLRVEASYNVGTGREEFASLTSDYPVLAKRTSNDAPEFSPTTVDREVSEGKKGMTVGAPVTATDDITNALNYTLGDAGDNTKFEIDQKTGQITTKVDLDREQTIDTDPAFGCGSDYECTVTVTATDSAGAGTSGTGNATVTIELTNVDEKPEFGDGDQMVSVVEGSKEVRADSDGDDDNDSIDTANPYTAMDLDGLVVNLSLMGADGAKFQLSGAGDISFKEKPDYENPTDRNKDNVYEVTVRASDGAMHADHMVMVTVIDDDEAPTVMGKDSVSYPENGTDPVATFTATDPEGVTSITWDIAPDTADLDGEGPLTADDAVDGEDFMIDKDGVLKFNIAVDNDGSSPGSPDFENPQSGSSPASNTYNLVVSAADAATAGNTGYHKVTVKVTKVAEKGKVTWTVDPSIESDIDPNDPAAGEMPIMQFQDGAVLVASVTDGDIAMSTKTVDAPTWQWYRGRALIDGETNATYTVRTDDVRSDLRVDAFYNVDGGSEESASLTSDYPVLAKRTSNDAPEFSPTTVDREVSEGKKGMTVGAPVTATDDITNALNYTLGDAGDNTKFEIDQKTGQITTKVDLDREQTIDADPAFGCGSDYECTVTVTATDSAGAGTSGTGNATVTIELTNVDEKPEFDAVDSGATPPANVMSVNHDENATTAIAAYTATDLDGLRVNLTLMGADGAKFQLLSGGNLSFKTAPDYENPTDANSDNVYEVTVRASDGTMYADRMVKVTVDDDDEAPIILSDSINVSGPASVGYAENGTDAVGTYTAQGANAAMARWSLSGTDVRDFRLSSSSGMSTMLMFRTSPDFEMPADADGDNVYMVTVKAMEGDNMNTRDVQVTVTNVAEIGVLSGDSAITYMENGTADVETYTPSGPVDASWSRSGDDAGDFTITGGVLKFVRSPDYEAAADANTDNEYNVTVMAKAGGETGMVDVTVTVTNVEELGVLSGDSAITYMEKGTADVATYTASGPVAASWSKSGDDAGDFTITGGVLKFAMSPDYEAAADANTDNEYNVTVMAKAGGEMGMMDVTVTVTNVEEMGMVTLWAGTVALTMPPQVGDTITGAVMDPDNPDDDATVESWQWSRTMDTADMNSWIDIDGETNAAYTVMEGDTGYYLRVMATYTDAVGTDMAMVHSMPTMMVGATADEMGEVTLWAGNDPLTMAPQVGDTITGLVVDPDGSVTGETWQWARSMDMSSWMDIDGATDAAYMVTADDEDHYLRVMATYTDAVGTDMDMAYSMPTMMVIAADEDPLVTRYDADNSGTIDKPEVIQAINDYLFGQGDAAISKPDVIRLIRLYLFG